jgi:hypothetical protein
MGLWSDELLRARPTTTRLNRYQGEIGGQTYHCLRILVGVLHELGEVVRKSTTTMNHPSFRALVNRLPKKEQAMWKRVRDLSVGKKAEKVADELLKALRNTTAFHYDRKEISAGFDRRFPSGSVDRQQQPLFTRGKTVQSVRLFFADAAATEALDAQIKARRVERFGKKLSAILIDVSKTIALLVEAFIEARSGSRPFEEEIAPKGETDDLSQ